MASHLEVSIPASRAASSTERHFFSRALWMNWPKSSPQVRRRMAERREDEGDAKRNIFITHTLTRRSPVKQVSSSFEYVFTPSSSQRLQRIRPQFQDPTQVNATAIFNSSIVRDFGPTVGATIDQLDLETVSSVGGWTELATPWFSDQILPFDITLGAANEYGAMAAAKIFGVEILNEATGVSIDDSVTETQASFVARTIEP